MAVVEVDGSVPSTSINLLSSIVRVFHEVFSSVYSPILLFTTFLLNVIFDVFDVFGKEGLRLRIYPVPSNLNPLIVTSVLPASIFNIVPLGTKTASEPRVPVF